MGIYAVTGGSSGIGARTVEILKEKGNEVINIDVKGGDITADLATPEGRKEVVRKLHEMCPDGLDAMICNAGVSGGCGNIPLIISLNYFGAIDIAQGVFDLLERGAGRVKVALPDGTYQNRLGGTVTVTDGHLAFDGAPVVI